MADTLTYETVWVCDDCTFECTKDSDVHAHRSSTTHANYTQQRRVVSTDE